MGIHKEDLAKFLVTNFNTPAHKLPNSNYFVPEICPLIYLYLCKINDSLNYFVYSSNLTLCGVINNLFRSMNNATSNIL